MGRSGTGGVASDFCHECMEVETVPELVRARVELGAAAGRGSCRRAPVEDGGALPLRTALVEHDPEEAGARGREAGRGTARPPTAGRFLHSEKWRTIAACSSASDQLPPAPASAVGTTSVTPAVWSWMPALAYAATTESVRAGPPDGREPVLYEVNAAGTVSWRPCSKSTERRYCDTNGHRYVAARYARREKKTGSSPGPVAAGSSPAGS